MIDRYIFSFALDNIGKVQKPAIDYTRCIISGQNKHDCKICRQVCHQSAISLKGKRRLEIDRELCRGCYLCSGVCPAQCISHHSAFVKSNDTGATNLVIGCSQNSSGMVKAKVPCLASLPWEFYAYFSYEAPITMLPGNCHDCPMNALIHIDAIKDRLKLFWGKDYEDRVSSSAADLTDGISRREFFGLFSKKIRSVKKSIDVIATDDMGDDFPAHTSVFRRLLLRELAEGKAHGWLTLDITESCWGCKICEKLCPSKSIDLVESGEQWVLSHNVARCTGCKLCKTVCPEQAVGELSARYVCGKNHVCLTHIQVSSCSVCGQNMKSQTDDICNVCKNKIKKITSR